MSEFLNRISKLSPQRLALLADELNERVQASERNRRVPIAVVGIGCRLPGGVRDADEFWKLLSDGVDAVSEVPPSRWDIEEFYDRNPDTPGKMATRWGGFIDAPDQFDPQFFGIAPAEAASMDPQQRLLLETSWEALEHAGIAPSSLAGTPTGVFVGICNGDYSQIALNSPREKISPYFAPGLSHAVAAGRISYVLGLQGPSMAVDTSCSASLVAVHLACQSLRLGECNAALAGGVNLILNPEVTIALSQSRMMAPDGRCKAFSDLANGFVRGEGCGIIVLKRLPDALRDRNRILAVIRGSACNQDGRSSGLTAPNGPSQEAVISAALSDAGLRPTDVDYIEAHGTGTSLGDPIEIGAINAVFAGKSAQPKPLFVGSVKTNLGHLEPAAGIAGLIKLVLSIQHGKIPASLHFEKPNSRIEWNTLPIKIPTELQTWHRQGGKRVGGVSSFGFSGTNAHVIVEEYVEENPSDQPSVLNSVQAEKSDLDRPLLFPFSAKTESALKAMAARLHRHLMERPSLRLADVAHTLNRGRSRFECRAALTAASHSELLELLSRFGSDSANPAIQTGRVKTHSPRVAFLFVGEQLHNRNSGRELYDRAPAFREAVERCDQILRSDLEEPVISVLYSESENRQRNSVDELSVSHRAAANFTLQYALAELWRACGIEPYTVTGDGAGEYVAACIAGVFSLEDGLQLAIASAREDAAELARRARGIVYQQPKILFLSNRIPGKEEVNSAEYWVRRSEMPAPITMAALAKENCAANLIIGDGFSSERPREFAAGLPANSLPCGLGDWREFLKTAGALWVLGCNLNTDNLYRDETAAMVSLPTYPFERERYWLEEPRATRRYSQENAAVRSDTNLAADPHEWIYDLVWEPKPLLQKSRVAFDANLTEQMPVRDADNELIHYSGLNARLDPVCTAYIANALKNMGIDAVPNRSFTLDELCQRFNIASSRRRLFARLIAILIEDGLIERAGDGFRFSGLGLALNESPAAAIKRLQAIYPLCETEMNVLARCGENLASVLQGATDPVHLLFPNNSMEETEHIYRNSPMARYYNESIGELVRTAVENKPDREVRILEVGAGTGATTRAVFSLIYKSKFEYIFTDISPAFLARARNKFAEFPSVHYRVLDIENDPAAQGFQRGEYDIIIAANVLHATADLRRTIGHIQELLAPGGLALLLEGMRPDRGVDLTFGLTDGWWRFADHDVRPDYPLVAADTWTRLLKEAGMVSTRVITYAERGDLQPSHQMVIVAQAAANAKAEREQLQKHYIILADEAGIGEELNTLLIDTGARCELIRRPESSAEGVSRVSEMLARSTASRVEIVYLWGTDVSDPSGSIGMLSQAEDLCVKTPIHIIQMMLRQSVRAPQLWLVTRGAQATSAFSPDADGAAQSMMWGVGRVFGLEDPEQYRGLIDLGSEQSPQQAAASIFAELLAEDAEDQIVYRDGQRLAVRLKKSRLETSNANPSKVSRLRKDSAYLITGGLGGIGLRLSRWAAEQGAGHLVLLGRTGTGSNAGAFAAERLQAIQEIRELGANVTIIEGDVTSERDMELLFRQFGEQLPPLRGVVHAATALSNVELSGITDEQIETMLRPKVLGTWILHSLTKNLDLDFFLAFSSAASVLGGKGMAHYAAANLFMDSFAHYRRGLGLPMLSVNWGAWDVMRRFTRQDQDRFTQAGLLPMESGKLFQVLGELLPSSRAQVMVANVDWKIMKPILEVNRVRPMLEGMGSREPKDRVSAETISATPSLHVAGGIVPEDRRKLIERFVQDQAARVLGFRRGELPPSDVPLTDLGLDSLMAVDLKNSLQAGLGRELSPTIVFDFPTVSDLVGLLETMLWARQNSAEDDLASVQKDEICI